MLAAQSPRSWAVTGVAAAAKDRDVKKKMERDMKKLEYLSLVSKASTELESHMGADRVLAEFVIDLGRASRSVGDFDTRLKANGADIADCLLRPLFTVIHATLRNDHPVRKVDKRRDHDLLSVKRVSSEQDDDASARRSEQYRIGTGEEEEDDHARCGRPSMSSLEKWETKQLIASSVLGAGIEHHHHALVYGTEEDGEEEEDVEVELNEDDAPEFLHGCRSSSMNMSPVKICRNPEGSLIRAAALQSALVKERKEVRQLQQRTMLDSIPKNLNRPWEDPMPETGERHLA